MASQEVWKFHAEAVLDWSEEGREWKEEATVLSKRQISTSAWIPSASLTSACKRCCLINKNEGSTWRRDIYYSLTSVCKYVHPRMCIHAHMNVMHACIHTLHEHVCIQTRRKKNPSKYNVPQTLTPASICLWFYSFCQLLGLTAHLLTLPPLTFHLASCFVVLAKC